MKKGDIVYHLPSKLFYRCENNQMVKWMNMAKDIWGNPTYVVSLLPEGYLL